MNKINELEKDFFSVEKLKKVSVNDCGEKLVDLKKYNSDWIIIPREDNIKKTGNTIFLRKTVADKLEKINKRLNKKGFKFKIVDGYRLAEVQKEYWEYQLKITQENHPEWSEEQIKKEAIKFCASPELSYHPTGGAVDLTIIDLKTEKELEMGTKINYFNKKSYSHFPDLSERENKNRKFLFEEMEREKFYNYPAEWWHFSFGTTDWALFYKKSFAIYDVIDF